MPGGDAEHPGPQRALAPERAQLREDDEQDLLRRVLGVLRVAQHPQRQPVAVVLQRSEKLLRRGAVARHRRAGQVEQRSLVVPVHTVH